MKPCPFCGGKPRFYTRDDDSFIKGVVVECTECTAQVETTVSWRPFSKGKDTAGFAIVVAAAAAEAWNRRPPTAMTFAIDHPGEPAAGLSSYTDTVTVEVESGSPGGEEGEFAEYMAQCLRQWYDGAAIKEG